MGAAQHYDPEVPPKPSERLSLDEQERIRLAEGYHRDARIEVPDVKAHAYAIVANQTAEGLDSVVRAMARPMNEGLSRHSALHAIGWVVVDHFYGAMNTKGKDFGGTSHARYDAAVERLTAKERRRK